MEPIIQTNHVTKDYQTNGAAFHALRGVSITVQPGEFVAVMGPSGSGKSTLLHLLGGLDSPSNGEITVNGQRMDRLNEAKRAIIRRKQIGFVFQSFNLINNLSVADNIELPALMAGMSHAEARQKRTHLLDSLGIPDKSDVIPSQLSGGQRQRVAIARALINNPALLLADEPTGNLDSRSSDEVLSLLQKFHRGGQTIFMVTHDPRVASVADRIIHMRDGQVRTVTEMDNGSAPEKVLAHLISLEV